MPYLTGMRKIRDYEGIKKTVGMNVLKKGLATPFINISFSGLLWGYNDELPCNSIGRPDGCGPAEGEVDLFADEFAALVEASATNAADVFDLLGDL